MIADYSVSDPLSYFAAERDKVRIKSSKIRQSMTSSSLEASRLVNDLFGLRIFCFSRLVRRAGH